MNPITPHTHNDTDSPKLYFGDAIINAPQDAVTAPTGGTTVDTEARTAINDMITKLQTLGILR